MAESTLENVGEEHRGGCLCGRIRYRITGSPLAVAVCHCSDCQKQSGSAFSMSMVLRSEQLAIESGEVATFISQADSGAEKRAHFCPDCGGRLYNTNARMPGTLNLKPGTLDDTRWIEPGLQVWTRSKQPWLELVGLRAFEENPTRMKR